MKSATFPVMGRAKAAYLAAGESLDGQRTQILHTEKVISIDGLLTADVLIFDIDDAMNHYDVASEYSKQVGEALAIAADGAVLAEIANLANTDENLTGLGKPFNTALGAGVTAGSDQEAMGKAVLKALTAARGEFTKNYVPASDRFFYCTPEVYSAILAALMPNAANYAALISPEDGSIRNVVGFTVVEVPHLTAGDLETGGKHAFPSAAQTPAKPVTKDKVAGLFCHRSAVGTVKLKDLALERARRPEYQADEIIGRYAMGHGGLRPEAVGSVLFGAKP